MKRRQLIKGIAGAGLLGISPMFRFAPARANHNGSGLPSLVVIFQRGGCDGLNTVVPFGDPDYYDLRPTLAIAEPDPGDPKSALNLDGFFGLHPSLQPLLPIYSTGDLAILPTVQYRNSTLSHFEGQDFIESGAPDIGLDGWLNRHLQYAMGSELRAVHFGSRLSHALTGSVPVQSFSFIDTFHSGLTSADEAQLIEWLAPVYNESSQPVSQLRNLVSDYGRLTLNNLEIVARVDTRTYQPGNGALYPPTSYGRRLRETAQLIKEGVGLEVATIDIGHWDTHSDQGGGNSKGFQARRLSEFAAGIAALYRDLGSAMENVIILTMTEFGRTAKENGSRGTDHGHAASWFVIGKNIRGGIIGEWPGLARPQLADRRYLQYTVDYRDIMGDILINHLAHSPSDLEYLLPGHNYATLNLL